MSTPISSMTREELEEAMSDFRKALASLKPVLERVFQQFNEQIGPFVEQAIVLKATHPWLFEEESAPRYDFDGNDLDAGPEPQEVTPHPFVPRWHSDEGKGTCMSCGKPELHYLHDETKRRPGACLDCGHPEGQHPNEVCDRYSSETANWEHPANTDPDYYRRVGLGRKVERR